MTSLRQLDRPIDDVDVSHPELFATGEAELLFARMRAERPVHYCRESAFGPFWSLTRYEDVAELLTRATGLSSAAEHGGMTIYDQRSFMPHLGFMAMDPPMHTVRRRVVSPAFGPGKIEDLEENFREHARAALDRVAKGEEVDLNHLFGFRYALRITADFLGMPQSEIDDLDRWSESVTSSDIPNLLRQRAFAECAKRFTNLRRRLADEPPAGDPVSLLVHHPATARMSAAELLGHVLVLMTASYQSVRSAMTGSVVALAQDPEERARIDAAPELIGGLPDEAARWQCPFIHVRRTAIADVSVGGVTIPRGDKIVMWLRSANLDETMFGDPARFSVTRENGRAQLGFGAGIHRCIGARFANAQVRVIWQEIVARGLSFRFERWPRRAASNAFSKYDDCRAVLC